MPNLQRPHYFNGRLLTAGMVYPGQGVPLARLLFTRGGWRLDRRHRVPRVR